MTEQSQVIRAEPSKAFFIDMLTRDIELSECILDLVDNPIHNLIRASGLDVMTLLLRKDTTPSKVQANIRIRLLPDTFEILDTCGGITRREARDEVFRMGYPHYRGSHTGLGLYGIGMKRAIFKMGRKVLVASRSVTDTWRVEIDVEEWEKHPNDWTFEFAEAQTGDVPRQPGTLIRVQALRPGVADQFGLDAFRNEIARKISTTYALFLKAGVRARINNTQVDSALPEVGTARGLTPVRKRFRQDGVDILIIAGLTPYTDRAPRGWYVFCNGRMVAEADRSRVTGWGTQLPQFHSKYNHFVGYVYFRSKDLQKLPWKTTKSGVSVDTQIYQAALREMQVQARPILDFLNRLYPGDVEPEGPAERDLLRGATSVPLDSVPKRNTKFVARTPRRGAADEVNILYKKPKRDVARIKTVLKRPNWSAKRIGEYTFDYFLEQECE